MPNSVSTSVKVDTLAGLRVLDFTSFIAGPFCGRLLADAGAEVMRIVSRDLDRNTKVEIARAAE